MTPLRREEAEEAARELERDGSPSRTGIEAAWSDLFVEGDVAVRPREENLGDEGVRRRMIDDLYGPLT